MDILFLRKAPLTDAFERLYEAIGLFDSIPDGVKESSSEMVEKFKKRCSEGEQLFDSRTKRPRDERGEEYVYQLQLMLVQLLPPLMLLPWLRVQLSLLETEFETNNQPDSFAKANSFLASVSKDNAYSVEELRSLGLFLLETRRQITRERTKRSQQRSYLVRTLFNGWLKMALPLCMVLAVVGFSKAIADVWVFSGKSGDETFFSKIVDWAGPVLIEENRSEFKDNDNSDSESDDRRLPRESATFQVLMAGGMIALAALSGACGSFVSVFLRIQRSVPVNVFARDVTILREAGLYIHYAPLIGVIFSIVLSAMFAGSLIGGGLFPDVTHHNGWYFSFWSTSALPKWLVWGFLAGFSERFVPDLLSKVAYRSESDVAASLGEAKTTGDRKRAELREEAAGGR